MNKKIFKKVVLLILACLISLAVLSACSGEKEGSVSGIQIVEGAFKEIYTLDEKLDLTNAKILVTYTDGSSKKIGITKEMVSGFDTSTTTTGRTITIAYKGKETTFIYKVQNTISVETSFRFTLGATIYENLTAYKVEVGGKNVGSVEEGIYAMRFTIAGTKGVDFRNPQLQLDERFQMQVYDVSQNNKVIVIYSVNGYDALPSDAPILTIEATKPAVSGSIIVQNASISDGNQDYVIPQVTCEIGE